MLSDEILEKVVERLVNRIEEANIYTLKSIGETIKKIGTIKPSDVTQLVEAMQYGADYDKIVKKLADITDLNVKDIYEIFDEVAKTDSRFAEQFYIYRDKKYIPYADNINLQRQVRMLAEITADTYRNMANSTVIGFRIKDENGKVIHKGLKETYQDLIDRAVMAISQGKSGYEGQVYSILKEIGKSGLSTVDYESGHSRRLDSAVRMNVKGALRDLHNKTQEELGKEFGADGVEISVHGHPAPDHEDVQGRQFSIEEFDNFQNDRRATTYTGMVFEPDFNERDRRAISQYNCYHYTFSIILGVNRPQYSDEQLQQIKDENEKGFEYEGKHYTLYEGTQLQRRIETAIRREKDLQILGKTAGNERLTNEAQKSINELTQKYQELSNISGLPTKLERLRVEGYTPVDLVDDSKDKTKINSSKSTLRKEKVEKEAEKVDKEEYFNMLVGDLSDKNVDVDRTMVLVDEDIRNEQLEQVLNLTNKYPLDRYDKRQLTVECKRLRGQRIAEASYTNKYIALNVKDYMDKDDLLKIEKRITNNGWAYKLADEKDLAIYSITHEYGHQIEYEYMRKMREQARRANRRFIYTQADKDLRDTLMSATMRKTGEKLTITQFKDKYFSRYAKSKQNYEWFAEIFAQSQLGEKTAFTEAFLEWLEVFYE